MTTDQPTANGPVLRRSSPPAGVWVLVSGSLVIGAIGFLAVLPRIFDTSAHWFSPRSAIVGAVAAILFLLICIASCGTWMGNRRARTTLLGLLAILAAWALADYIVGFAELLSYGYKVSDLLMTTRTWRDLALFVFPSFWFGLNCWYFLGARAQIFFASERHGRSGDDGNRHVHSDP